MLLHWDPLEEVPFAVHLDSFFPRRIHCIKWNWDGEGAGREESPNISPNLDGIFMVTGIWRVPCRRLTCLDLQVQVSVQHSPGDPQWRESFTWGTLVRRELPWDRGEEEPGSPPPSRDMEGVNELWGVMVPVPCHI